MRRNPERGTPFLFGAPVVNTVVSLSPLASGDNLVTTQDLRPIIVRDSDCFRTKNRRILLCTNNRVSKALSPQTRNESM